ncbi:MAG: SPOR domain-containing protein [Gammaproteobacteria bacterium]
MASYHKWLFAAGMCALIAACSDPQGDWESAQRADTLTAYEAFLAEYPQGSYADRARARMAEMEREAAWNDAQTAGTTEAYAAFLNQYPDGAHSEEAAERRMRLERQGEWERIRVQENPSEESLREFVAAYPDSMEAAQARTMIASLEAAVADEAEPSEPSKPAPTTTADSTETGTAGPAAPAATPAGGDFRVQLGAFRAEDSASAERDRLRKTYGALLGEITVDDPAAGSAFYRVRSAPMTRDAARDACAELEAAGQACFVVDADT